MKQKSVFLFIFLFSIAVLSSCESSPSEDSKDYPITPVDFTGVKLEEGFWKDLGGDRT